MLLKKFNENLKKGKRALDGIIGVKIEKDWQWDPIVELWFIKISVKVPPGIKKNIPEDSIWYVAVDEKYPQSPVKIYPDAQSGFKNTFEHQSNNGFVEKNDLWRKGSPCLDSQLRSLRRYDFDSEPTDPNWRIFWHVKRLIDWIDAVNNDELVTIGEPFELPQFNEINIWESKSDEKSSPYFVFSEDEESFRKWGKEKINCGIAELEEYNSNPFVYFIIKEFKTHYGRKIHGVNWGKYLSIAMKNPVLAIWVLLNEVPVINKWQAPNSLEELIDSCYNQDVDLCGEVISLVNENSHSIRDGKQHLLLLGFPIPEKIGGKKSVIHWQAFKLPVLFTLKDIKSSGFRKYDRLLWKKDKYNTLTHDLELEWLKSQNWSVEKITNRGRLSKKLISMNTLIIGSGTIGSSVAELLVRAGVTNISIIDYDSLEVGNLSRHTLGLMQIGKFKSTETAIRLNHVNPHVDAKALIGVFKFSDDNFRILDKFDLIIDCTAENYVLDELEKFKFKIDKIFVSVSIGFEANNLYLSLQKTKRFQTANFYRKILPWVEKEIDEFPEEILPRDGVNCWSPVFPARYDDIFLASGTTVKVIKKFVDEDKKELNAIYRRYSSKENSIGYKRVDINA